MQSDTPSPAAEGRGGKRILNRRDVIATTQGEVSFTFPETLTEDDYNDVVAWLAIVQRKLKRFVAAPASPDPVEET